MFKTCKVFFCDFQANTMFIEINCVIGNDPIMICGDIHNTYLDYKNCHFRIPYGQHCSRMPHDDCEEEYSDKTFLLKDNVPFDWDSFQIPDTIFLATWKARTSSGMGSAETDDEFEDGDEEMLVTYIRHTIHNPLDEIPKECRRLEYFGWHARHVVVWYLDKLELVSKSTISASRHDIYDCPYHYTVCPVCKNTHTDVCPRHICSICGVVGRHWSDWSCPQRHRRYS